MGLSGWASEQANEWAQRSAQVKQAVWGKQMHEWMNKWTDERKKKWTDEQMNKPTNKRTNGILTSRSLADLNHYVLGWRWMTTAESSWWRQSGPPRQGSKRSKTSWCLTEILNHKKTLHKLFITHPFKIVFQNWYPNKKRTQLFWLCQDAFPFLSSRKRQIDWKPRPTITVNKVNVSVGRFVHRSFLACNFYQIKIREWQSFQQRFGRTNQVMHCGSNQPRIGT